LQAEGFYLVGFDGGLRRYWKGDMASLIRDKYPHWVDYFYSQFRW